MKKYIFLLLVCVTSAVYASDYMRLTIKNNTPETCTLVNKQEMSGMLAPMMPILHEIPSGRENVILVVRNPMYGTDITFSYKCGEDRAIAINTKRSYEKITPTIINAIHMDATYNISVATSMADTSAIEWTLY